MRHWLPIVILLLAQGPRTASVSSWLGPIQGSASYRCQRLAIAVAVAREQISLSVPSTTLGVQRGPDRTTVSFEPAIGTTSSPFSEAARPRDGPLVS